MDGCVALDVEMTGKLSPVLPMTSDPYERTIATGFGQTMAQHVDKKIAYFKLKHDFVDMEGPL